jgi:hypothetical protein
LSTGPFKKPPGKIWKIWLFEMSIGLDGKKVSFFQNNLHTRYSG